MGDDRPAAYEDNGKVVYRASALGGCLVALAAARQGFEAKPYPKQALEVFEAGNKAEEWFFGERAPEAFGRQEEVELAVTGRIVVRAHVDAYGDCCGVEVKSQTAKDWETWTPDWFTSNPLWVKYAWQVSVMMLATGMEWDVVRVDREQWRDACWTVEKPFFTLDDVRARVFEAEALAREPELKCPAGEFFCAYPYLHATNDAEVEVVEDAELEEVAASYAVAKVDLDVRSQAVKRLREKVLEVLGERRKVRLTTGRTVTRSDVEVPEHVVKASRQTRLSVRGPK